MGDLFTGASLVPNRNYYPLPSPAGGGGVFDISNMWDTLVEASEFAEVRSTGNPHGTLTFPFTANVVGGIAPFTYAWNGPNNRVNISSQTTAATVFSCTGIGVPYHTKGYFNLTLTDSTVPTPQVITKYLDIEFYFDSPPP